MEWIKYSPIFVITILRLLVPIGITILVAWFLQRLDAQWNQDAFSEIVGLGPAGVSVANLRCWDVHECGPERRKNCSAFLNKDKECWEALSVDGQVQDSCVRCRFRKAKLAAVTA